MIIMKMMMMMIMMKIMIIMIIMIIMTMMMIIMGGTPNLHFPHLHRTQIYKTHIYTKPRFTQTQIYTAQIYTHPNLHSPILAYPNLHNSNLHQTEPKFTQPKFTQNPNLQIYQSLVSSKKTPPLQPLETTWFPPRTVGVSNYIQPDAIINPWLVKKRLLPCSRLPRAALEVQPHMEQLGVSSYQKSFVGFLF